MTIFVSTELLLGALAVVSYTALVGVSQVSLSVDDIV